jgi:hypothetical protein
MGTPPAGKGYRYGVLYLKNRQAYPDNCFCRDFGSLRPAGPYPAGASGRFCSAKIHPYKARSRGLSIISRLYYTRLIMQELFIGFTSFSWPSAVMIAVGLLLIFLAIKKEY